METWDEGFALVVDGNDIKIAFEKHRATNEIYLKRKEDVKVYKTVLAFHEEGSDNPTNENIKAINEEN